MIVQVLPTYLPDESFVDAYESIEAWQALLLLNTVWPEAENWASKIIAGWAPLRCAREFSLGCYCGSYDDNTVFSTINDIAGGVEGLLHEAGHLEVHNLGIHFEEWDPGTLANSPEELYESPIRKDKLRPMGAVLHAQYSYLWVLEWYNRLGDPARADRTEEIRSKLAEGCQTIKAARAAGPAVQTFLDRVNAWSERIT